MRPYNTQCAPGAPAVLRGLRFAHIVIYTPNVTLGAHDLPTEDRHAAAPNSDKLSATTAEHTRSTPGAHDLPTEDSLFCTNSTETL